MTALADPKVDAVREALLFTRWGILDLEPTALERVAAYLDAIRNREPVASGESWWAERIVLGYLVTDLRSLVIAAGEPVGPMRDLRDAKTKADEVYARQRADHAIRAYDALITSAIEEDERARELRADQLSPQLTEEDPAPAPVTPAAAMPDETPTWWS